VSTLNINVSEQEIIGKATIYLSPGPKKSLIYRNALRHSVILTLQVTYIFLLHNSH